MVKFQSELKAVATALVKMQAEVARLEAPLPASFARRPVHGRGQALFGAPNPQPFAKRRPAPRLGSSSTLFKGYPEYRNDQPRGKDGKWGGGGGAAVRLRDVPNLAPGSDGRRGKGAIQYAMSTIPEAHYKKLTKTVPYMIAVKDMGTMASALNIPRPTAENLLATNGLFHPGIGVIIADAFDGFTVVNQLPTIIHELAHALDYYSGHPRADASRLYDNGYYLSEKLGPTMQAEYGRLPKLAQWYTQHYDAEDLNHELFAELYSVAYGPKSAKSVNYMVSMTRKQVMQAFPKSIAAMRAMNLTQQRPRN